MINQDTLDQEKTILFLHIPKTGGSTLSKIASQNYDSHFIYRIDGKRGQDSVNEFQKLPIENKKKIKFLEGHFSFGLHEHLSQLSTYITILREPVDRVISTYYYLLNTPMHPFHKDVIENNMSFEECLESKFFSFRNNSQVRMLSGTNKYGGYSNEILEMAKYNLKNFFSVVGTTENFDDFLILCQITLGWKLSSYAQKVNVTKKRPTKESISKKARRIIEKNNSLDIELYNFVKEKFFNYPVDLPLSSASAKNKAKVANINSLKSSKLPSENNSEVNIVLKDLLKEGNKLKREGKITQALDKYSEVLQLQSDNITALNQLAEIYESNKEFDQAIQYYQRVVQLQPDNSLTQAKLARAMIKQGNSDGAIASYQKAIALQPEQPVWVYIGMGDALNQNGQLDEAIATYQKAIEIQPDNSIVHVKLARVLMRQKKIQEAITLYQKAIALQPEQPVWVYIGMGDALNQNGQLDEAIAAYQKAIDIEPDNSIVQTKLARAMMANKKTPKTITNYQKASYILKNKGYCYTCDREVEFSSQREWLRDWYKCSNCGSIPSERALIYCIEKFYPQWKQISIHESSPGGRGASIKLKNNCPNYQASQYFPGFPCGEIHSSGWRNEDLENQTFADESFDLVITQDVMEHIFNPDKAFAEIARTLKPGGAHIFTVPIINKDKASEVWAKTNKDGTINYIGKPEYHGNPVDSKGSLVTMHWGYDICDFILKHSGFIYNYCLY